MPRNNIIIITMVLNFVIAMLKLVTGVIFSFSTLIADSIQSFTDFITDITSLVANKIGKRRSNKTYPFGYGQVYYIANLFTGFLLFLIGIFILYQFFFFNGKFEPNFNLAIILLIILALKLIVVTILHHNGKKFKSELLIEAYKESKADLISTCVVLIIMLFAFFESYIPSYINIDKIGCFCMAIYVLYISITMLILNIKGMLANDVLNNEIRENINNELNKMNGFLVKKIKIIKMATYYSVFLQIVVDEKLTIKKYIIIEKKIKSSLKKMNKLIRFIDIELV